ncbi:hypothetical protein [Streptomyces sp. MST-110588]|uniref:phthiocerol/phthiodiolone dimycocerosyl transferase family protein n=1 Tax=Streptomyces sp. MST-110588 TaxID=2833628 RepID=UPI001F5C60CD|nr:hypothetical protein [Streptomyces sp. MST-110588]UNO40498.1 hypothetical protein KGS77_14090 [Streptomyces sp. MST-110588]
MSTRHQRPLSPFESRYFLGRTRFGSVPVRDMPAFIGSVVRGRIDVPLLERALCALADHHPLLRCEVVGGDGDGDGDDTGAYFRLVEGFRPRLEVLSGGDDAYDRLLNTPPDWQQGLFRAYVFPDGELTRITLVFHHGVMDGRSGFALLSELWERYTSLVEGAIPPSSDAPAVTALPEAIDERLAAEPGFDEAELNALIEQMAAGYGLFEAPALPTDAEGEAAADTDAYSPAGDGGGRFARVRIDFDAATTAALVASARAAGTSLYGLVCGAALIAVRSHLPGDTGPMPLLCGHAVDLRGRLEKPLSTSVTLNCASGTGSLADVAPDSDPLEIGRLITADLAASLARRDPESFLLASVQAVNEKAIRAMSAPPSIAVSNIGRIPAHRVPEDVEVVRDEVYAMAVGMPPKICVFTLDGHLAIQNEYDNAVHSHTLMQQVTETLRMTLLSVTKAAAPAHDVS